MSFLKYNYKLNYETVGEGVFDLPQKHDAFVLIKFRKYIGVF